MVQVLHARPARERRPDFSDVLGGVINAGVQAYSQHQKGKQEQQEFEKENEKYKKLTGRDLSKNPRIREKEVEFALRGEYESQKEGIKHKSRAEEQAEKLKGEQKTQKEMASFADRLEASDPKFKGVAEIYRLDIPLDQKTKIVQSLTGTDIYREDQQKRLQLDSVLKRYNSRLKELDDEIKSVSNPHSTGKEEADALRRQRMALRGERDQLLDFRALNGMEEEGGFEDSDQDFEDEDLKEEKGPKVAFDSNNKKHRAVAEKLFKKYKDKEKVRKILSKQFKGL